MGGGGKGGAGDSAAANQLAGIVSKVNKEVTPIRQEYTQQLMEALTTGGSQARIPIMQKAVESVGRSASNAMRETGDSLTKAGLAGTPYGERILAETGLSGEVAKSGVQMDIVNQMLQGVPGYVMGQTQNSMSGLGSAAGAQASIIGSQSAANAAKGSSWTNVLGGVAARATPSVNCCFIFIAASPTGDTLHPIVRRYRDEHMNDTNRRGYYRLADIIVPWMRRSLVCKWIVRLTMVDPMISYGKYVYGEGRIGKVFEPLAKFWLNVYTRLGRNKPYIRSNGEVI